MRLWQHDCLIIKSIFKKKLFFFEYLKLCQYNLTVTPQNVNNSFKVCNLYSFHLSIDVLKNIIVEIRFKRTILNGWKIFQSTVKCQHLWCNRQIICYGVLLCLFYNLVFARAMNLLISYLLKTLAFSWSMHWLMILKNTHYFTVETFTTFF